MSEYNYLPGGFGARRKRSETMGEASEQYGNQERRGDLGIQWPQDEGRKRIPEKEMSGTVPTERKSTFTVRKQEATERKREIATNLRIDGYDISIGPLKKHSEFPKNTQKITSYLSKDLVSQMKILKEKKYIPSFSWLIEEAVKHYLISQNIK